MQQVTRRPAAKKDPHKGIQANRRRIRKSQKRKAHRKLKSKLVRLIDMVGYGYYSGVRESPLLSANFPYVKRVLSRRLRIR